MEWSVEDPEPPTRASWGHYVLGVAALLRRRDRSLRGATLLVHSEVPIGAGLGSSAAIEVASALALADVAGITISVGELARLCQQAEVEFVGARVGIMDQFVATHARAGHALLLDCRCLEYRVLPLPTGVHVVACNTMVRHSHAGGEYNRRRAECEAGVAHIAARVAGVRSLRDVDEGRLEACRGEIPDVVFRRCRHVVRENARVLSFVRALERGRTKELGPLMSQSHRSLADDYEVSCPELEAMVDAADAAPGSLGTRLTGGGFGGCTVSLVRRDHVDRFGAAVIRAYAAATGREPEIHALDAGGRAARVL
jgi:galactokinase